LPPPPLFLGGTVPFASAVPSVAVEARGAGFGAGLGGGLSSLVARISRSAATGVTMPDLNMTSWVNTRIAEETTM
jgi:hypothetical protein